MGSNTLSAGTRHLARLDVLRGFAILMVVAFHTYGAAFGRDHIDFGQLIDGTLPHPGWSFLLLYPLHFGSSGVALFFVISGYVIHRSYLLDRSFRWSSYVSRRFWRIYPAYAVALAGFAVLLGTGSRDFVLHAGLLHNVSARTFFGINPSFWSLAVEVQLYMLYPVAIFARKRWSAAGMLLVGVLASIAWRSATAAYAGLPGPGTNHLWINPVALWPDWLLGAYMAELHLSGRRVFARPLPWLCGGAAFLLLGELVRPMQVVQFSVASLVSAVAVEMYLHRDAPLGRTARLLAMVGVTSYSLYLIHQPFMAPYASFLASLGLRHPAAQVLVGFPFFAVAVTLAAWVMYMVVERGGVRVGRWVSGAFNRRAVTELPPPDQVLPPAGTQRGPAAGPGREAAATASSSPVS